MIVCLDIDGEGNKLRPDGLRPRARMKMRGAGARALLLLLLRSLCWLFASVFLPLLLDLCRSRRSRFREHVVNSGNERVHHGFIRESADIPERLRCSLLARNFTQ